jgi:hypothetical protein
MPKFIVLAGKKQSGKTTSANYLKEQLLEWRSDLNIHITSFASPIKEFCTDVIGLTKEQVYGADSDKNSKTHIRWHDMPNEILDANGIVKLYNMTAREVMQVFGTDVMRNFFGNDIWAKAPFNKDWNFVDYVIIDDCRFPNEADAALENDGILIKLTRNALIGDNHASELALDDYDETKYTHIIDNHMYKNIDCLYADLEAIVRAERY